MPGASMGQDKDKYLLELSQQFLTKLNGDKNFAMLYETDPAGALQNLFPQLANVPKSKLEAVLNANSSFMESALRADEGQQLALVGGIVAAVARVAATSAVRSAATAVVSSVAGAVASSLMGGPRRIEPTPE